MRALSDNRRWIVPFGVLAVILAGSGIANLVPAHAGTPDLPALSAAELLVKARTAHVAALAGTVSVTSNLGLPSIGNLTPPGGSAAPTVTGLLAGTHSFDVWIDGPDHLRVATSQPLAETNWVRNGPDVWSYDSTTQRVLHATISPPAVIDDRAQETVAPEMTPPEFAQRLLDQVAPSTEVRVDTARYVANRPVYELVLTPKTTTSTVLDAVVSVDAATGLPLAVRIDATSGSNPAFRFGFTKVRFEKPAASVFAFTAPPGSTVTQAGSPRDMIDPAAGGYHRSLGRESEPMRYRASDLSDAEGFATPMPHEWVYEEVPTTIGRDWSTVVLLRSGSLPGPAMRLFAKAPTVQVGLQRGRLLSTKLLNAILLDDGRVAVGAITPHSLAAALAAG